MSVCFHLRWSVCVGGVPVCVSCQSACLALGWGKAPCGMEAGAECASWGEFPKPQSNKLTAGMLGSPYSLTPIPFFLDSPCYLPYTLSFLSYTVSFSSRTQWRMFRCLDLERLILCHQADYYSLTMWQQYILQPLLQSQNLSRPGWCHLVEIGFLYSSKAHRPFGDWSSNGTNELSARVTWKAKAKYRIKQNWFS